MAAIALSFRVGLLLLLGAVSLGAQQSRVVREQLAHVASALSAGHPQEAMDLFDKSFGAYEQLRGYFVALTDAHTVTNEIDVTDEQIEGNDATLAIHWTLTLSDLANGLSESREQDLTVRLTLKKNDWLIADLTPVEFFNPEAKPDERKPAHRKSK
jgi:hypothetical protein